MRISRIYINTPLQDDSELTLTADTAHYLVNVLRVKTGQPVLLFNNTGIEVEADIVAIEKKSLRLRIRRTKTVDRESPLAIHLAIGISRGERMDFVLQKSTELGVQAITPLFCERTEVRLTGERLQKKMEHWQKIIINACEQCGRTRLPVLHPASELHPYLQDDRAELKLVLHHRSTRALRDYAQAPASISLLIGPEGGLSTSEIAAAENSGCQPLTLGPRVLRTETAPLVALSVLQHHWGDLDRR